MRVRIKPGNVSSTREVSRHSAASRRISPTLCPRGREMRAGIYPAISLFPLKAASTSSNIATGLTHRTHSARARANDFGGIMSRRPLVPRCGARTRKGTPCSAQKIPGRKRCKWHGGLSTGPRSCEGRLQALRNLVQFRMLRSGPASCAPGTAFARDPADQTVQVGDATR
jgi:hypothetical protein